MLSENDKNRIKDCYDEICDLRYYFRLLCCDEYRNNEYFIDPFHQAVFNFLTTQLDSFDSFLEFLNSMESLLKK